MTKTNVPRLRFREFDGEWRENKLIHFYKSINNAFVGTASPYYTDKDNGYFYLESNNVKNGTINEINKIYINKDFYLKQKAKWLKKGDIVMVQSGHVGHSAVITDKYNNLAAHALIMLKNPISDIDSSFINQKFQTNTFKYQIGNITTGNTIKHILATDIKKLKVFVPAFEEQKLVSSFFAKMDSLIELQTQKLEQLKKLKKGYLQKMFPQDGESVPRLRFSGFSGEWEESKLEDYLILPKLEEVEVKDSSEILSVKLNLNGVVRLGKNSTLKLESTKYYKRRRNQFIYGKQNFFNGSMAIIPEKYDGLVSSGDVPSFDVKGVIPEFLLLFVSRKDYYKHFEKYANGTGSKRIHENVFLNFDISVPSRDEQCKIISLFETLNNQINNEREKLDSLNKQKKAYLQKMFI